MIPPKKGNEPDLAFAGIALLVVFSLLIWHDNPIKSDRPTDSSSIQPQYPHTTDYSYESWLWQDPFSFDSSAYVQSDQYYIEYEDYGKKVRQHLRLRKKLDLEGSSPSKAGENAGTGRCITQLKKEMTYKEEIQPVKILASLLNVRPNTVENKELRARHRYAVIAGLIESGYHPSEPDRLHFCSIQNKTKNSNDLNKKFEVRWERYSYKDKGNNKPDIIVAWVNSNIVHTSSGKGRSDFNTFVSQMSCLASKGFHVFDWSSATGKIAEPACLGETPEGPRLDKHSESSEVTANLEQEKNKLSKPADSNQALTTEHICEIPEVAVIPEKGKIKPVKPAGSEPALAQKLICKLTKELELREVDALSEIAIIAEEDTQSVRDLTEKFSEHFKVSRKTACSNGANDSCEIKTFSYLKGLDAYQQIIDKEDQSEDYQAAKKWNDRLSAVDLRNPPVGPGQFDYLHRLAAQIKDTHDNIDLEKRNTGIKAVGIFGSDFYDKLLILEALRAVMPNILVFTTDLDAQMLHPEHWRWTRNLVVASPFDLKLDKKYQKHFPAFRDSQQTDIYYNTYRIATDDAQLPLEAQLPKNNELIPLIFEIGRNGPVRLAQTEDEQVLKGERGSSVHPADDDSLEQAKDRIRLLFGIAVSVIILLALIRPHYAFWVVWLFTGAIIIFATAWFAAGEAVGEAFSFTDGTSLWPTIFIQIIAILLAFALLRETVCILERDFYRLSTQYFQNGNELKTLCVGRKKRLKFREIFDVKERRRELLEVLKKVKGNEKKFHYCVAVLFLVYSSIIYAYNDRSPSDFWLWACLVALALPTALYFFITDFNNNEFKSVQDLIEDDDECWLMNLNVLWRKYHEYSRPQQRLSRVVAMWLVFAIIETMLIYLLPPWPSPCRGYTSCFLGWAVGLSGFVVVMILTFLVLDAVRLNFHWIQKLRTNHPLLVDRSNLKNSKEIAIFDYARRRRNNPLGLLEKMVTLVAERTRVVDKLIYYPLLCIMLMLFAQIAYFDNQDFPLSKGITFGASISLLIFAGFMIRYEAEQLRLAAIKSAEKLDSDETEKDKTIEKITGINDGAFEPMLEQPVMRALLLILASVGVFAGEYLKLFG